MTSYAIKHFFYENKIINRKNPRGIYTQGTHGMPCFLYWYQKNSTNCCRWSQQHQQAADYNHLVYDDWRKVPYHWGKGQLMWCYIYKRSEYFQEVRLIHPVCQINQF